MVSSTLLTRVGETAGIIYKAVTHPPYGWGEHRDFESHSEHESVIIMFEGQPLAVEYYNFPYAQHAPTVFIFNGFSASAGVYGPLGKAIWHHEHNVVLISLPGHGGTDLPKARPIGYADTAAIMVEAIGAIRQEIGMMGPIVLLGHSHGGGVAAAVAAQLGGQVNRLILLASVGGPKWTEMMAEVSTGLDSLRNCKPNLVVISHNLLMITKLLGEGFLMIPPPWQGFAWGEELLLPAWKGVRGLERPFKLWSVAVDTIIDDALALEGLLETVGQERVPTACVAGDFDGVIDRVVIEGQAELAAAGVFHTFGTHASFLGPQARNTLAELVCLPDEAFAKRVASHRQAA